MTNTQFNRISDQSIHYDECWRSKDRHSQFHLLAEFKRKWMLTDKMKAIGEESLAWILTISATTAAVLLIQFVLNLK